MAQTAVVVPSGPADDTRDTLDSILHYAAPPRIIVLGDDSGGRLGGLCHRDITVIPAPTGAAGSHGSLWIKLSAGDPMAITWGLPSSPQDLLRSGALVTYSVRHFRDLRGPGIRVCFVSRQRKSHLSKANNEKDL
jgi:hypothetical protein